MAQLDIDQLCKGWDFPVLDRLSFSVEEGEFFVVVGPSGIGKTTLLRLIAGLERPDLGEVYVGDRNITPLPPYRRPVAMTFESYALYPHLTVFENIASPLRARRLPGAEVRQKVQTVAELLRIDTLLDRRPGEISGGQKQRTALGRTLVAEPEVFLLDEPLSHLDARIRHELRQQFHQLEALRQVATLYVTHDYAEALSLGDRIGIMGNGGLVQVGSAREVFLQPHNLFVAQHLGQPTINAVEFELTSGDDGVLAAAAGPGLRFAVAAAHRQALERSAGGRVTVGIRPQHLQVVDGSWADPFDNRPLLDARVDIFEALGANGVLVVDIDGVKLTALTEPQRRFTPGQPVRLRLNVAALLYFAADGGARNLLL